MESDDTARDAIHSNVRCEDIVSILKSALLDPALIEEAKEARSLLGKRSAPGDLVVAPNGWDAIKLVKTLVQPHVVTSSRKTLFCL